MAEYTLIAMDMDGTLLNSQHQISPRSHAAITETLHSGKQVVFATGRCLAEMGEYLPEFPDMRYLICENGACVYDLKEKRNLYREPLLPEITKRVIDAVEKEDVLVSFFIGNRSFMNADSIGRLAEYGLDSYVEVLENTLVRVPDLFEFYRDNPLERMALLKMSKGLIPENFIEGMACALGGCNQGPAVIVRSAKNNAALNAHVKQAGERTIGDAVKNAAK